MNNFFGLGDFKSFIKIAAVFCVHLRAKLALFGKILNVPKASFE